MRVTPNILNRGLQPRRTPSHPDQHPGPPTPMPGDPDFEADLANHGIDLLRPARNGETPRAGARFFEPLRQIIESINQTLKGQLDLERHQGRTPAGVCTRIAQRILALTAAIWHNDHPRHHHPPHIDNRLRSLTLGSII